jgi:hypothetical protein
MIGAGVGTPGDVTDACSGETGVTGVVCGSI